MNVVLDEPQEVYVKTGQRKALHQLLLKGDNIVAICPASNA
jgi:small nuclear ribonucleoprotein (snRNP)-like protein